MHRKLRQLFKTFIRKFVAIQETALHVSPPTFTDVCPRSRSPGNAVPPKCMVGRGIGHELYEQGLTLQGTVPRAAATKQVRRGGAQKQFAVALTVKHLRLNERSKTKLSFQQHAVTSERHKRLRSVSGHCLAKKSNLRANTQKLEPK